MPNMRMNWVKVLEEFPVKSHRLESAFITTYDQPDRGFLAQRLLPAILGINQQIGTTTEDQTSFFGSLLNELDSRPGFMTIVSSEARDESTGPEGHYPYAWLLRGPAVTWLRVGKEEDHVQHAKLWLLHWKSKSGKGKDRLSVVISSANLTEAALAGQIQGAWLFEAALGGNERETTLQDWLPLTGFLAHLAKSAGAETAVAKFESLISRLPKLPAGHHLVPCVPGHDEDTSFGLPRLGAVLAKAFPGKAHIDCTILAPYLGDWSGNKLEQWSRWTRGTRNGLQVAWPHREHPWAGLGKFAATKESIESLGEQLRCVPDSPELHPDQSSADLRWPHAKLYGFAKGKRRALLLTSANFSPSAWGLRNFEIGILIEGYGLPKIALTTFVRPKKPAITRREDAEGLSPFRWSAAYWDGEFVTCAVRLSGSVAPTATARASRSGAWVSLLLEKAENGLFEGRAAWKGRQPPVILRILVGNQRREIAILDQSTSEATDPLVVEEVDGDALQYERDCQTLAKYNVCPPDLSGSGPLPGAKKPARPTGDRHDYHLVVTTQAREWFMAIDNWSRSFDRWVEKGIGDRASILREGATLLAILKRIETRSTVSADQSHVAAAVVVDELRMRLERAREYA